MLCYSGNNRVVMLTRTNRKHPEHLEQLSPVPYTIDALSHTLTHTKTETLAHTETQTYRADAHKEEL